MRLRHGVSGGFTLIEMMVVMVLLGMLSALALPSMRRWHEQLQVRAEVSQVTDALRSAMFSAGARRQTIVIDRAALQETTAPVPAVGASAPASDGASPPASAPSDDVSRRRARIELPKRWRLVGLEPVTFHPDGLCSAGALRFRTAAATEVVVAVSGPLCAITAQTSPAGADTP